ncbi:MAG TPA: DNA polymerase III subunit epsilon [Gammaproteobacteria bacterium]|nr:DNA polymerase III subunit epsilon [Gammaproteobacteria bacterium]
MSERLVVLDTETTGLSSDAGHRIIEIACVELENRLRTGRKFHSYLNPDREIEAGARDIHGITDEQLRDQPRFGEIAGELREFISGATLVIHNAPFDVGFLDSEYRRLEPAHASIAAWCKVTDSLAYARNRDRGLANSLDALCRRYHVDNSGRDYHGALLDAQLLVDVWLALTGGQVALALDRREDRGATLAAGIRIGEGLRLPAVRVSEEERAAHRARLASIRARTGHCLWDKIAGAVCE